MGFVAHFSLSSLVLEGQNSTCVTLNQIVRTTSTIRRGMNQGVQGKFTNKATPTRTTPFSEGKEAALGGTRTHDTLLSRQSALSKSTTQHNTTQGKDKPQYSVLWHRKPSLNMYEQTRVIKPPKTPNSKLSICINQGVQGKCITNKAGQYIFQRKKELPWVGLVPTTFCFPGRALFLLSYQGSSQAGL